MPISKANRLLYPANWPILSRYIRFDRAAGRCEFDVDGKRCEATHGQPHPITGSTVVLTTAHLDHNPVNSDPANLKAGCQRCHNRWDREHRNETRRQTRARKAVR